MRRAGIRAGSKVSAAEPRPGFVTRVSPLPDAVEFLVTAQTGLDVILSSPGPRASCSRGCPRSPAPSASPAASGSPGRRAGARWTRSRCGRPGSTSAWSTTSGPPSAIAGWGSGSSASPGPARRVPAAASRPSPTLERTVCLESQFCGIPCARAPFSATIRSERDFLTGPASPGRRSQCGAPLRALEAAGVSTLEPPDGPRRHPPGANGRRKAAPKHFEGVLTVVNPLRPMTVHRPSGGGSGPAGSPGTPSFARAPEPLDSAATRPADGESGSRARVPPWAASS